MHIDAHDVWLAVADAIYIANFGYATPQSAAQFLHDVLTTPAGWHLIVVGNGVGLLFAVGVLTISVVAFPLLLDRDAGAVVALLTSVRAVAANPATMALWGLMVAVILAAGSLPLFFGLALAVPVLGHATWHLYRKVVAPDPAAQVSFRSPPKKRRYAADFPAVLFPWTGDDRHQTGD